MTIPHWSLEFLEATNHGKLYLLLSKTDAAIHALLARDHISDELVSHLVHWLRIKAAQHKTRGVVVGISGGVDSATVAALARGAFPSSNRYFYLPCRSIEEDGLDAQLVAEALGIPLEVVDINPGYVAMCTALGADPDQEPAPLHLMNLKAMLRTNFLVSVAIASRMLVAGTGNRSEMEHTGYFSLRGDGACDHYVLGHFFKRQVCDLAVLLGVPEKIVAKPPSHGLQILADGTTPADEVEMGMRYADVETSTRLFMEFGPDLEALANAAKSRYPDRVQQVLEACQRLGMRSWMNRHKTEPMPIAGYPRKTGPIFEEYPQKFPYPDRLEEWRW
ncbi:MAG: NAD(+) synthase [Anaerolineales bacterium]|nr:NAD(+) synthase [Anaerolineales bacterium]